jgi:hypothetical protein
MIIKLVVLCNAVSFFGQELGTHFANLVLPAFLQSADVWYGNRQE